MVPQITSFTGTGETVGEAIGRAEARANGWLVTAGLMASDVLSVNAQTSALHNTAPGAGHWLHTITITCRLAQPVGAPHSVTGADSTEDLPGAAASEGDPSDT